MAEPVLFNVIQGVFTIVFAVATWPNSREVKVAEGQT